MTTVTQRKTLVKVVAYNSEVQSISSWSKAWQQAGTHGTGYMFIVRKQEVDYNTGLGMYETSTLTSAVMYFLQQTHTYPKKV